MADRSRSRAGNAARVRPVHGCVTIRTRARATVVAGVHAAAAVIEAASVMSAEAVVVGDGPAVGVVGVIVVNHASATPSWTPSAKTEAKV
jgi:hypothetical protein